MLLQTIINRPYVFLFLIAYLVIAWLHWGKKRTLIWLVIGYVIAWISEVASINTGFPYGWYFYNYQNMPGELMVAGVPFWDSLSYPFMIFAGYKTAEFILGIRSGVACSFLKRIAAIICGSVLTMVLDIIIDPLTNVGEKWFLGKIYYYPEPGPYFGVPISNFAGWFFVPLCVILAFVVIERFAMKDEHLATVPPTTASIWQKLNQFLPILLYLGIACFNIAITIWIGELFMASVSCLWLIPVVGMMLWRIRRNTSGL